MSKQLRGLRIGEVAALTGMTARAIRHYHSIGLCPEPARDSSGYRRYRAADVVSLARVRRLRAFGMSLDQIAGLLATQRDDREALRQLADEIAREITELQAQQASLLAALEPEGPDDPAQRWLQELRSGREHGANSAVAAAERSALELVGVLHPGGLDGAASQAAQVLDSRAKSAELGALVRRFRALGEDEDPAAVSLLAADMAAALPRPEGAAEPVPVEQVDALIGDRLTGAQRACMHEFRRIVDERDR